MPLGVEGVGHRHREDVVHQTNRNRQEGGGVVATQGRNCLWFEELIVEFDVFHANPGGNGPEEVFFAYEAVIGEDFRHGRTGGLLFSQHRLKHIFGKKVPVNEELAKFSRC